MIRPPYVPSWKSKRLERVSFDVANSLLSTIGKITFDGEIGEARRVEDVRTIAVLPPNLLGGTVEVFVEIVTLHILRTENDR